MEMNVINPRNDGKKAAIIVKNAHKSYPGNAILKGLSLTVPEGTIYGLLGSSGCGKSTLLNCILGRGNLDSGRIEVNFKSKAEIGYMPQEIALYSELSIGETMTFYGRIFGIDDYEIERRIQDLTKFLELPPKSRILGGMSGGQQRRVSFAVALIHNPRLLILDEPTAGVDPLLCVRIWDTLLHMVQTENKTVIVTTHYIEETRQAHTIGLMRDGKLLAEDSPEQLMVQFNVETLEDVFLALCTKQTTERAKLQSIDYTTLASFSTPREKTERPLKQKFKFSKKVLFALLSKNLNWMKRNPLTVLVVILIPILNCCLFCACVGNDPTELKLAVINEEVPQISNCETIPLKGCNFSTPLSCRFLKKMEQKTYELTEYYDMNEARKAVKKNKAWGLIYFRKNFTASLHERLDGKNVTEIAYELSNIQIWLDMSNQYIGGLIKRDAWSKCVEFLQELFHDCRWSATIASEPIKMEKSVYGGSNPTFRHSIASNILAAFQFYLPMTFTIESIMMERTTGSLDRNLISGMTVLEIAVSLTIIQWLVLTMQTTFMMLVLFVAYDNPLEGNLISIILLLGFAGGCGMSLGFLIAVISTNEQQATFMGIGTTFAIFLLCGTMWPLQGMPDVLRHFSYLLPATQSARAFEALSAKSWTLSDSTVYEGFITNFAWSCVFTTVSSVIVSKGKGLGTK
ncbi:ABC transporter G family member 23-like [Planococcus citri]|uniref:ABC transporter G family member 23-like n=1 Tax=Planococcus citri TaxID=170843 RepID=UPI0031F8AF85